jgi:hypothetical protein
MVGFLFMPAVKQQQCRVAPQLLMLPAASQLPPQQLGDLLQHAIARQLDGVAEQLCRLPPAMQLDLQFVADQLTAALELGAGCDCVEAICSLLVADQPRQQALTAARLDALLQLAMQRRRLRPIALLLCTPAAVQHLSTQRVQELLLHATQQHNDNSVEILSQLAVASSISHEGVEQIITAAIRVGCCGMLMVRGDSSSLGWWVVFGEVCVLFVAA